MHDKEPLDKKQSKQREDTIFKLIRKVTAPPKDNEDIFRPASIDAVLELGKLKAVEAIPVLLQNLTSIGPLSMDDMFDYTTNFPCSAALIEIGEPAVEPCVKLLQTTPSIKERNVLLHILGKIKGNVWLIEYVGGLAEKVNPIPSQPFSDIQNRLKNRG